MKIEEKLKKVVEVLRSGELAVIPTDTVLGIVASAFDKEAIKKLYKVRLRSLNKPCIVLISDYNVIFDVFNVKKNDDIKNILKILWDSNLNNEVKYKILKKTSFCSVLKEVDLNRSISVVLACDDNNFSYLHLNTNTIAFRIPSTKSKGGKFVYYILNEMKAIIAPSANLEGQLIASNISEARKYFGDNVLFYMKNLEYLNKDVSHVIQYIDNNWKILR